MAWIYILENKINGKIYCGQTINIDQRFSQYKTALKKYNNFPINRAINKYGWNNFNIYSFECDECDLDYFERGFIKQLNTLVPNGYNLCDGGHKNKHYHPDVCKKISNAKKGKPAWNKGIKQTREHNLKNIICHLGQKAWNKGIHQWENKKHPRLGKTHTEKVRKIISKIHKGKKLSKIHIEKISKKIICIETGKIFNSIKDAGIKHNMTPANISMCLYKKSKTAGGYHWEYYKGVI